MSQAEVYRGMASFVPRAAPRALTRSVRTTRPRCAAFQPAIATPFRRFLVTPAEQPRLRLGLIGMEPRTSKLQPHMMMSTFMNEIGNSWVIIFSHPADFTSVCTAEFGAFAKLQDEFEKRGFEMIGLSANDLSSHGKWVDDMNEISETNLQFPILADADRSIAYLYDMITEDGMGKPETAFTIRSVFIIDLNKKIERVTLKRRPTRFSEHP